MSYEWVTGSLKNVGGKDLCAFSAEPLKLAEPVQDALKIVHDEAAKPFQQLTLPDTHLAELKLPNAQQVNAQILMPVDVSKITEAAPLVIPGTTLAANLQPCETIDGLIKPEQINKFTASLSKLVEPATAAGAGAKAADDAKAAATGAVEQAADATTKATEEVKEAAAKAGEALKPQEEEVEAKAAEDVSTEAISPANSLTASLAGLAAVAAALAFQFVL